MDELPKVSYYKTLGVPKDATLPTIRSSYRKLVLSCHPDKTQDEAEKAVRQEKFHEVQQAYETLSDESKRHKYDEKVKVAELRAERTEILNERSIPRRTDEYFGQSRGGVSPRYDIYDGVRYEVREPPPTTPRTYDRYTFATEYTEERRSSGKYDDRYTPRKSSGRGPEDKRRAREDEDERERDRRMKDREREAYARDSRKRDKDRRRESEAKSSRKFAYVDEKESESELDGRYYKSKRDAAPKTRYEEPRKRSGDEEPRKSSKRDSREYADSELESKTGAAKDYIKMNRSREAVEPEPSRRPAHTRTTSKLEIRTPPPPPPSYPTADSTKRSSGRGRAGSRAASPVRSKKDRRTAEIVETPLRGKNNIPPVSSATKGIKSFISPSSSSRTASQRSAIYQHTTEYRPKPLQRSETMPVDRMHRSETRPLQTSTLRNMKASSDYSDSSSDSDSEMTEEILLPKPRRPSPRQKTTSYRYKAKEDDFVLEPEEILPLPRRSEESPSDRRPPLPSRTSARPPTTGRSTSHAYPTEERSPRQSYSRTESARVPPKTQQSPKLYRELSPHEESPRTKHSSPKVYTDEVRYADKYARRGSGDTVDRDAWPGSFKKRPHIGRSETAVN